MKHATTPSFIFNLRSADEKSKYELIRTLQVNLSSEIQIIGRYKDNSGSWEIVGLQDWAAQAEIWIFVLLKQGIFEALELSSPILKIE